MEENIKVAIILVNYNTIEHTLECIKSILKSEFKGRIQIIVVDNNSDDNCAEIIHDGFLPSEVILIENSYNYGFAKANNIGVEVAKDNKCSHVLILNNDTVINKNTIQELFDAYEGSHSDALITGKILNYYNRSLIWYAGGRLSPLKGDAQIYGFNQKDSKHFSKKIVCDFASGCCMFSSIHLFEKNALPERYFLYYEDVDFCHSLKVKGIKIIYNPRAVIYHKESASTKKKSYNYSYYFTRNRFLYLSAYYNGIKKIIPSLYTFLWLLKKTFFKEFDYSAVVKGFKDYKRGVVGEKKN